MRNSEALIISHTENKIITNRKALPLWYFLAGLLAEETEKPLSDKEWLADVNAVVAGYESVTNLSTVEKGALACVMECIEILCAAYFAGQDDIRHAEDACRVLHRIRNCML